MIAEFVTRLGVEIATAPERFYDSFDYTCTGTNLTHPKTLGLVTKILWTLDGVASVGVDVRINDQAGKLQPDVVAYGRRDEYKLLVDYESPNSSDKRVPEKDVLRYLKWSANMPKAPHYVVITTLPDRPCPDWQLRYVNGYNHGYSNERASIRSNPFKFWYDVYQKDLRGCDLRRVQFVNIDGRQVKRVRMST